MNANNFGISIKALMASVLFVSILLISHIALAASHNITLSAEVLPNGQFGYKMISHTSSEGSTPNYSAEAVIPGPTIFVTQGDKVSIELTMS